MDPVKEMALSLIEDLVTDDFSKIKSHIGLIELACDIVEETAERLKSGKFNVSAQYKRELAITLSHYILAKLVDNNMISEDIAQEMDDLLKTDNLEKISSIIDDIINIWNDAKIMTIRLCYCLGKSKRRVVRKFEHLKPRFEEHQVTSV